MTSLRRPFLASRRVNCRSQGTFTRSKHAAAAAFLLQNLPAVPSKPRRHRKTSAARLGHQHPSQGETRPRPLRQCQETRVFRDPVDAKMSLPSQDTLPTTCKRAEFGVLQASNPTKQELLLIENVPQALSFKCLRQFSIKSNSRFVSIVLLNWRSVVLCRLNSALSLLFLFFKKHVQKSIHAANPLLHCSAAMSFML